MRLKPPGFWQHGRGGLAAWALQPAAWVVARQSARRVARPGWRAPVPVLCVGNAGVGGAGKTTLVLDLVRRLQARGVAVHVLTRGYGGRAASGTRVDVALHGADLVGDEALLLAAQAPTWVGANRVVGAQAAVAAGAQALVMDDGLQNPGLVKDFVFLTIDGGAGFGNGRVLPAGPLREPVAAAVARAGCAVMIGADETGAAALLGGLPVLRARLVAGAEIAGLAGQAVYAFAGIGRPEKFFGMLRAAGVALVGQVAFADHARFSPATLARLRAEASRLGAVVLTTEKDYWRIPPAERAGISTVSVSLAWQDEGALTAILARYCL